MDNASRAWERPAMRTRLAAIAIATATWLFAAGLAAGETPVDATETPTDAARRLFELAQSDEDRGAFADAVAHDRASIAMEPGGVWAQRAVDRLGWLTARSEGDFAPLVRLESVRQNASLAADPAAIDALARDAQSFPPGLVRVEARMFVADAWLGRMHRPDDAVGLLRAVREDTEADPLTARLAEHAIVDVRIDEGRLDEAAAEAAAHADRLDPGVLKRTRTLVRRRGLRDAALIELGVFAALAGASFLRAFGRGAFGNAAAAVRRLAPMAAGFAAYVGLAGGLLASRYETGNAAPFLLFGSVTLPLVLVARAWSAIGATSALARAARAVLCAASVFAIAFMLLDAVNPTYLEGFGL